MAGVGGGCHRARQGVVEAGPAGAAFELGLGVEQFGAAAGALELAGPLFVVQRAGTGPLGAVLAQHAVLFGGECRGRYRSWAFPFPPNTSETANSYGAIRDWLITIASMLAEPAGIAEGKSGVIEHIIHLPARGCVHQQHRVVPVGGLFRLAGWARRRRIGQRHRAAGGLGVALQAPTFQAVAPSNRDEKMSPSSMGGTAFFTLAVKPRLGGRGIDQLLVQARATARRHSAAARGIGNAAALAGWPS